MKWHSRGSPFNFHIKSISASKFKPEEVRKIIQEGGNEVSSLKKNENLKQLKSKF